MWEAFKKIYDNLKQDEQNRITGVNEIRKKFKGTALRKAIQSKWRDLADIVGNPFNKLYSMDISKSDGDETHERLRKMFGRPKKEEFMKTVEEDPKTSQIQEVLQKPKPTKHPMLRSARKRQKV